MYVHFVLLLLMNILINHGQTDQMGDLTNQMNDQLRLINDKIKIFETDLAQIKDKPIYRTAYACEYTNITIACEKGMIINLIRANYGRSSISICNDDGKMDLSIDCSSARSFSVISSNCDFKNNCTLLATNTLFKDPCPGTLKYLEAHYQCVPAWHTLAHPEDKHEYRTAYACEYNNMTIGCEKGMVINLIRANYGRSSISICNDQGHLNWSADCSSARSFSVISSRCSFKNNCTLLATNQEFDDPCPGPQKYLEAYYQCVPAWHTHSLQDLRSKEKQNNCEEEWIPYLDNKCFRILNKKGSEVEAKGNCSQLDKSSTLITIQSKEEQNFLSNRLKDYEFISINVWIGLEFVDKAFQWMDGKELKFENWDENAIKDGNNKCVKMSLGQPELGKWTDELCEKKYQIICQKKQSTISVIGEEVWNLTKVIDKQQQKIKTDEERINSLQSNLEVHKKEIETQRNELDQLKMSLQNQIEFQLDELDRLRRSQIPIGFIYVQLSGQSEPHILWPQTEWNNVSPKYAGLFFRAEGGGSSSFGQTQEQQTQSFDVESDLNCQRDCSAKSMRVTNSFPLNGILSGFEMNSLGIGKINKYMGLKFKTNNEEIRPSNQAIRIWIRIK